MARYRYNRKSLPQYLNYYFDLPHVPLEEGWVYDKLTEKWQYIVAVYMNNHSGRRSGLYKTDGGFVSGSIMRADIDRAIDSLAPSRDWYFTSLEIEKMIFKEDRDPADVLRYGRQCLGKLQLIILKYILGYSAMAGDSLLKEAISKMCNFLAENKRLDRG